MSNTLVGADQALRLAQLLKEQQPQGRMVGNMYLAPGIGDYLSYGMDVYDATRGQKEAAQEQAANAKSAVDAMNQYGIQAPESLIRQMQPRKSGFERLIGLVRGDNAPEPYQQNIVQNPTQQQREGALLSLIGSNPELASNLMAFEKIKMANAKEAEQERSKGVPTGFRLNEQNQLVPMPIAGGGDYAQFSLDRALAGQRFVNPVEAQNMQMQQAKYALDAQAAKRAEESAKRAEELANQQKLMKQWEFENPNANKNIAEIQNAQAANARLQTSLQNYKDALSKSSVSDIINPAKNAELQSIYQSATWPLRDETLMNTGVLNPGEMPMLNKALTDPSSIIGLARGKEELINQIDQVMKVSQNNAKAIAKSRLPSAPPGMEQTPYWTNLKRFAEGTESAKPATIPSQSDIEAEINRRRGGK